MTSGLKPPFFGGGVTMMISSTPGDAGRDSVHQDRRRISGRASGHIDPHPGKATNPLPDDGAVFPGIQPALLKLAAVEVRDVGRRAFERGIDAGSQAAASSPSWSRPTGSRTGSTPSNCRVYSSRASSPGNGRRRESPRQRRSLCGPPPAARGQLFEKGVFGFPIRFHQWHYHIHAHSFPRAGGIVPFGAANMSVMNGKSTKPV